jgi:hypothetical protein
MGDIISMFDKHLYKSWDKLSYSLKANKPIAQEEGGDAESLSFDHELCPFGSHCPVLFCGGLGIGSKLVTHATDHANLIEGCKKILLYCSKRTQPFYEKLGYRAAEDTIVMKFESSAA